MTTTYTDIELKFNIKIIPTEIKGNRWSCLVKPAEPLPLSQPVRIRISETEGFIIYPHLPLNNEQVSQIQAELMERL